MLAPMSWTKRDLFIQVGLPVIAILVTIVVAAWPQRQVRKDLRFEVIAVTPLGPAQASGFQDLRLQKGNDTIDQPYLASVRFVNVGEVSIVAADFEVPITIAARLDLGRAFYGKLDFATIKESGKKSLVEPKFIDARIAGAKPSDLPLKVVVTPGAIEVGRLLLNQGDEFVVETLVSGGPPNLYVSARIAGVKDIQKLEAPLDSRRWRGALLNFVLEFAAKPLQGQELDIPYLRKTLAALARRVELDPASRTTRVQYRVGLTGAKLASPLGNTLHDSQGDLMPKLAWEWRVKAGNRMGGTSHLQAG